MPSSLTGNLGDVSNISGDLASEWGCSTCVRRLHTLRNFVGADGKAVFCRLAHPCRTDLQSELNGKCEKIISEFNKRYGADFRWDFEIVTTETMFKPFEKSGKGCDWEEMGQYRHYSYVPTSVTVIFQHTSAFGFPRRLQIFATYFQSSQQDWFNRKYDYFLQYSY